MTSLRMRVVEAGARAIRGERDREKSAVEFHGRDELQAEAALDAMLDCLTENADEWAKGLDDPSSWISEETTYANVLRDRLTALREDR